MRRRISLLLASALLLSLALTGCGKQNSTTLSAKNTGVYGKVTEISGNKISFDVVTISEAPNGSKGQGTPPELPSGESAQENPPEMPNGDNGQGNPPEKPNGDNSQNTPPEKNGESGNGETPPDVPNGQGLSSTGESGTVM